MIFLITGRIGTGALAYAEAMNAAGFTCVQDELAKLGDKPVVYDGAPRYAVADPNHINKILTDFPSELFHIIYIKIDEDDEEEAGRRARYVADSGKPADEAAKTFIEQDAQESPMFNELETGFDALADKFKNFRAMHTITNNFDPTTVREWADYFYKYHTMYTRLINLVKLGVKYHVVNCNDNGDIRLVLRPKNSEEHTQEFVSKEIFADILLTDNTGLAMLTREVLESATADEIAEIA